MPKAHKPRSGSMQYWPRKRAKRVYARVRSWPKLKDTKLAGFAGYKVGMCHSVFTDNRPNTISKGQDVSFPLTIIECPPIKIAGIIFYKNSIAVSQILHEKPDKELKRKIQLPKKIEPKEKEFDDIRLLIYTQPKLTTTGNKKPGLFEVALGGSKEDKLKFAKENLGKEINIKDVFTEGQLIDVHAITKGKGVQGPVKKFGIHVRRHKSEKTKRGPGSLGGWISQGHVMYRVSHAGKMGYHQRTHYNLQILKIGDKPEDLNPKSGFKRYGLIKNSYILIKGSIQGPNKRIIRLTHPIRKNPKIKEEAPDLRNIIVK